MLNDAAGNPVWSPARSKCVKGIGWYIEEYGIAQVSVNLTDIGVTPGARRVRRVLREPLRRAACA